MKNLLTASQMKVVDAYTIQHQPITSIDLMEQAAAAFVAILTKNYPDKQQAISVVCGQGNNGGDGLAIARILADKGFSNLRVLLTHFSPNSSADYQQNLERLRKIDGITIMEDAEHWKFSKNEIVIDALLGSGLNKPLSGEYAALVSSINNSGAIIVSVDVPTGFSSEGEILEPYQGIKADLAISFQRPKINFFFPESAWALRKFEVAPIGLEENYIQALSTPWKLVTHQWIEDTLRPRENFSHKGTYGHVLMVAGNAETMGAALLAAGACLNIGAGLVTACIPQSGLTALNVALPEAMFLSREELGQFALKKYQAIAVGPGLGVNEAQIQLLEYLLKQNQALVLDADALNFLSTHKNLLDKIPTQSILTPHMKEFDRLFGDHNHWWQRVETAKQEAQKRQLIIVLKNRYTFICLPTGEVCINPTGNPAMSQGGMGDVLTGAIAGLLAQGYSSAEAAIIGTFVHGKTGDALAKKRSTIAASLLSNSIPKILKKLKR